MKRKKKKTHGGPRPGSGRPADPDAKVDLSLRVPPDVRAYLDTCENISETVAEVIRRTKAFRDWQKES